VISISDIWHIRCSSDSEKAKRLDHVIHGGHAMKTFLIVGLFGVLALSGCQFLGGAATGALATGAGYEIQAKRQMDRLEDDFKSGRISREEYESRKRQIESGSIVY
jgi:hypothetical protein